MKKMKLQRKNELTNKQKLNMKLIVLFVLAGVFLLDLIYVCFFKEKNVIDTKPNTVISLEHKEDNVVSSEAEDVPKFGTEIEIKNFDEQVVLMLGEKSELVERAIKKYVQTSTTNVTGAEIFHSTIINSEEMKLCFFCRLVGSDEIISVTYDYKTETADVEKSSFTEEEIVSEIWQGEAPAIRDIEE